jgi:predicted RNase H-like HicB family nuclease
LPGVFVTAETMDELREALVEAVGMYLNAEVTEARIEPVKATSPVPVRLELVAC